VGVTIGIVSLRLIAGVAVKLIERFPILEHAAFVLIGYVGLMLVVELGVHFFTGQQLHIPKETKFVGIVVLIALSLAYAEKAWLRSALQPVLLIAKPLMKAFVLVWNVVWMPITWPYHKLVG
jgi:tellurite resistance protein TerC